MTVHSSFAMISIVFILKGTFRVIDIKMNVVIYNFFILFV